jgi:hypothetical protein
MLTQPSEAPRFGRRASDRGFVSPTPWFGRRVGDKKAPVRHSLPYAAQIAAQIAPSAPAEPAAPSYASTRSVRAGLVKDFKA